MNIITIIIYFNIHTLAQKMRLPKQKKTKSFKFLLIILLIIVSSHSLKGISKSKQIAKQSKPQQVQKKDHQVTPVVSQTQKQKQTPKTSIDNNDSFAKIPNTSVHQSTTAVSTTPSVTAVSAPTTTVGFTTSTLSQVSKTEVSKQEYPSTVEPIPSTLQPVIEEPIKVPAVTQPASPQISNMKPPYSFKIKSSDNQYVIPVQIGSKQYNFGILYAGKQEKNGQFPSWVFTSLTDDDKDGGHQLCDENGDCQQIQNYIKCQEKSGQGKSCYQQGKLKYNQQNISCKKKVKLKFKNQNQQFQSIFASPSKITLPHTKISQGQIQGMINLSLDNQLYYSKVNSVILNHNNLTVVDTEYIKKMLDNNQQISLAKHGIFSLFTDNTLYIRTQHTKNGSETNNIEQKYHKITIGFNRADEIMALPRKMLTVVKNILKKQYFGERCKINEQQVICSGQPIKNITSIKFCVDKKGKKCFQLSIMGRILKQVKANQKYKLLVQENKNNGNQQQDQDTIVFYPKIAQVLQIYAVKGDVKGTCVLGDVQVTPQSLAQVKETTKKTKKNDQQQEQKSQEKSQEQQSNKKSKKMSSVQQQSQQQLMSEQESQKVSKKTKQKKEKKSSSKFEQRKQLKGLIQQEKSYSRSLLIALFIYGGLFIIILILIKLTARESMAAALIDRFLDITWYRIVSGYFSKSQGYTPPQFEQQDGHHQQIDRSDSIAVGISQKEGKTLFWEKNSVQGI